MGNRWILSRLPAHIGKRSVVQCLDRCSLELKAGNALHAGNSIGEAMREWPIGRNAGDTDLVSNSIGCLWLEGGVQRAGGVDEPLGHHAGDMHIDRRCQIRLRRA